MSDTYEGWSNRETWAANLWLSNDEATYGHVCGMARDAWDESAYEDTYEGLFTRQQIAERILAQGLEGLFDGWAADVVDGEASAQGRAMIVDIGSLYRIDWREIAGPWLADAIAEATADA